MHKRVKNLVGLESLDFVDHYCWLLSARLALRWSIGGILRTFLKLWASQGFSFFGKQVKRGSYSLIINQELLGSINLFLSRPLPQRGGVSLRRGELELFIHTRVARYCREVGIGTGMYFTRRLLSRFVRVYLQN